MTAPNPPAEEYDPRLGTTVGGYELVEHIADGATGSVYRARRPDVPYALALKILHRDHLDDRVTVERFRREYDTALMLDHPHVVKVADFGHDADGIPFMVMELLHGVELGGVLSRQGRLPVARTLRILAQTALALEHAHSFGVIHRDLKPDNIFLCDRPDGVDVRLLDFGSVKLQMELGEKLTAFGTTLGSPYYMSPEQAKGLQDLDARTDVFALTAVLYECLTGQVAFEGKNVAEILMKILRQHPAPPSSVDPALPRAIDRVVARGLAKDKTERPSTPTELVELAFAAFGLRGSVEAWAGRAEPDFQAALAAAGAVARAQVVPPTSAPSRSARAAPVGFPSAGAASRPVTSRPPGRGRGIALFLALLVLFFVLGAVGVVAVLAVVGA
ncbi:MAG: serine/threonine-protein kinase [Sandaracinaceae bacterium]